MCLLAAAVVAYPVPWKKRIWGVLLGGAALAMINIARIVALYFVGVYAPASFNFMHEEVMQVAIVVMALFVFVGWSLWAGASPKDGKHLIST